MKTWIALFTLMVSLSGFAGEIHVKVNGMVCSMCAQGIQKKFKAYPEVKSVDVNLDNKMVKIETQDGKDLNDEVVTNIIKEAGYNVAKIERK
jgi:copper chaperone CopZ